MASGSEKDSGSRSEKSRGRRLPETVGKYLITRLIGEGGMGRVYRGIDPDTRKVVAVKTILEQRLTSPAALPRFHREIQILAAMDHPGVVKILDQGLCSEGHFLVMEHIEGKPLDRILRKGTPFRRDQALDVIRQICQALEYLHGQGVMHRDLKPGNILVDGQGRVTLVDFGLSRFLEGGATVTAEGRVIGSPHYLPPEQWRGEKPDHRADIYQVGILAIELLTGKVPFSGTDLRAIMESCLHYGVGQELLASMGITGETSVFLRRCTRRQADHRYPTMTKALADLERVLAGQPLLPLVLEDQTEDDLDLDAPTDLENPVSDEGPRQKRAVSGSQPKVPPPEKRTERPRMPSEKPRKSRRRSKRQRTRPVTPSPTRTSWLERLSLTTGPSAAIAGAFFGVVLAGAALWVLTRPPPPPPPPELVVGPLVDNGMASAEVRWETDRPIPGVLQVRGAGALRKVEVEDQEGPSRDHRVFLRDLEPGAQYSVQALGPEGPLGEEVAFVARGVSIAFDPLFTRNGLELHWRSEDPLVLGNGSGGVRIKPNRSPANRGLLTLPGVLPGAGSVTVVAFSPMGSVLTLPWTVPDVAELAQNVVRTMDQVVAPSFLSSVEEKIRAEDYPGAATALEERLAEACRPFSPRRIMTQASLVLDETRVPLANRLSTLRAITRLRRMAHLLSIRGFTPRVPTDLAQGDLFRWGAVPGKVFREAVLARWSPSPAHLQSTHRPEGLPGGEDRLRWDLSKLGPQQGRVTFRVHCLRFTPTLALEVVLGGRDPLVLLTTDDVADKEELDGQEGWTTLFHSFDGAMLGSAPVLELRLRTLVPDVAGRMVSIHSLELAGGGS